MLRFSILLLAVLAVLSQATQWGVERTDMFDDLGDSPGVGNAAPFSSDGGVIYNGFGLVGGKSITPSVTGIKPHSGTHDILTQRPARGSFATTGRCVVLKELWFGCKNAAVATTANKPLECLLTLTSFDGKGKQNGVQKVTYKPDDPLLAHMMQVSSVLPPARVVQINATVLDGTGTVGTVLTGMNVDDVKYTQYTNDAAGDKACGSGF